MHLYLIGYRGSGKTTVAKILSTELTMPWIDTDQLVEKQASQSIRDIFSKLGEKAFRDLESAAIRSVTTMPSHIVSLGGGAILSEENRKLLRDSGKSVWLQASPETLRRRIAGDGATASQRPSLTGQDVLKEISSVLATRTPLYQAAADFVVSTEDKELSDVVSQIKNWFEKVS